MMEYSMCGKEYTTYGMEYTSEGDFTIYGI